MIALALFLSILFFYTLVSHRFERTPLTAPIIFTIAGMLMFPVVPRVIQVGVNSQVFLRLAEFGLVLLLFTDASQTNLKSLRRVGNLPARLLTTGLLSTVLFGAVAARLFFPQLSVWETGILATILAPTDAGLGQVIVSSPRVPGCIREALKMESGLNDGLSVPFLLFFMTLAAVKTEGSAMSLMQFVVEQLGIGLLLGTGVGLLGGWLLGIARRRLWMTDSFQQIGVVALPLLCLVLSEMLDASMFIASFVAGLAVQVGFADAAKHSVEFTEEWGQLFNLSVFCLFGMVIVRNWAEFSYLYWLYAVISLTLVRILPVTVALMGTRLDPASRIFIGWFGPRGLASIVLGLVYLEQQMHLPGEPTIRFAVMTTVFLSILLHGLTAMPGIALYTRNIGRLPPTAPEHQQV